MELCAGILACYCFAASKVRPDFIPAVGFVGEKPGFVFQNGEQGLGYYRDETKTSVHVPKDLRPGSGSGSGSDSDPDEPPILAPAPIVAKLTPPAPEPEPAEPARPEPEFFRPTDAPIASWPRERIADGALALTIYYLRGQIPGLLREYPVSVLTEALHAHLATDRACLAVLILAQPEEDGAGLFSTLVLDAAPREEQGPKSAIKQRRKVRSGGVNRGQLEVEGHFDDNRATRSPVEGAESFLNALSAVPYNVSFEYRKEFASLLKAAGSPDLSGGFGAELVPLPSAAKVPKQIGDAGASLRAVHLLGLCDPIEPPRPGATAAIVRLAAKDWVELTNVRALVLFDMSRFLPHFMSCQRICT